MASVINRPDGSRWVQFVDPNKKRQTVRLGKVSKKAADAVRTRVEELLAAKVMAQPMERDTAVWLRGIDLALQNKLAAVGLCAARESAVLESFIQGYVQGRTDVKPATKEVWRQGEKGLVEFFGANKPLRDISPGDADRYKLHLIGKKLASMTVRKRLQFATMIFRAAVRRRLIGESPFADVSMKASMPNRERFISPDETTKLLRAAPDQNWRTIIALARYGGLRCPSEVLSLRWQDIDWTAGRIEVQSPKTAHHPGKETRIIPLFPELREQLEAAFDPQAIYVVDERMRVSAQGPSGWRNCNLRTTFEKIVRRADLVPWTRPFHNLRSSRQTELAEKYPSHVVCDWLGNSEDIARKHYYQTTDDHFARAQSESNAGQQNPKQSAISAITVSAEPAMAKDTKEAKQNPKQSVAAEYRHDPQAKRRAIEFAEKSGLLRFAAMLKTDGVGFEPTVPLRVRRFSRPVP
jgi:integrase